MLKKSVPGTLALPLPSQKYQSYILGSNLIAILEVSLQFDILERNYDLHDLLVN